VQLAAGAVADIRADRGQGVGPRTHHLNDCRRGGLIGDDPRTNCVPPVSLRFFRRRRYVRAIGASSPGRVTADAIYTQFGVIAQVIDEIVRHGADQPRAGEGAGTLAPAGPSRWTIRSRMILEIAALDASATGSS